MTGRGRWLSENPDKAWAELFFLAQSPVWILAVTIVVATGWVRSWGDAHYLAFGTAAALPAVVGPLAFRGRPRAGRYWIKLNVWCGILVAFGTYFGTHYFFDLMGMRYAFPVQWTFSSAVVGRTAGEVPVFMYPLTQAYFVTYFTVLVVVLRKLRTGLGLGAVGTALAVAVLAYVTAYLETFFMAGERLAGYFDYADRGRMLAVGSIGYAVYSSSACRFVSTSMSGSGGRSGGSA